jgi:tetratricopeptide (TPR) repeat protein
VRLRLPASDTTRTRRITTGENGHRSSALITMAEGLRRPKFSPLTLIASLAALLIVILAVAYWRRPSEYIPGPETAALYAEGVDAMRAGAYYRASELLEQAVTREERYVQAHARLAEALMEMDFLDRAKDEMLKVSQLAPDFTVFKREDALYLEAISATVRREYTNAIGSYQEIVKLSPEQPRSHLDLGRAYERNNQVEKAIQSYTEATTRDNSYAAAYLRLGTLHARQRNLAGATAALDSAQKLYVEKGNKEGEAAVLYQRGWLYLNLRKTIEARDALTRALALAQETNNKYQQVLALQQLAQVVEDPGEAEKTARSAIALAQASGMNDQVSNGYNTLGIVLNNRLSDAPGAESNYNQALQIARNFKLRRFEAQALLNLGSLYFSQNRLNEAEEYANKARDFYAQAGYPREADTCAMLLTRIKRQRGDYDGALAIFEEMLRRAEQTTEMGQVAGLHRECAAVLIAQEKYPQARDHFRESVTAARAVHNQMLVTYSQLGQANALWNLGHYDEAASLFAELTGADAQTLGVPKEVPVYVHLSDAEMELSRGRYPEAADKAKRALDALKGLSSPSDDLLSNVDSDLGLAELYGGSRAQGRKLCEEGVRLSSHSSDPGRVAYAQYSLALALLETGDGRGAAEAALRAQDIFTRTGRPESEWRALALVVKASRRAGDDTAAQEYLSRAVSSLKQLEQSLGAEAASYFARPDVQWLRSELGASAASAVR